VGVREVGPARETVCLVAVADGLAGDVSDPSQPVCITPTPVDVSVDLPTEHRGCVAAPAPSAWWVLGLIALARRRRSAQA
jgi:MYXO-CTERM domain-containing protein